MPTPLRALPIVLPRGQHLKSVIESRHVAASSRDLAASWKVFGHLRPSESWGPVASQERALPPVARAAASKPVPRAGPQSLRTREEESFRRSE